jgi:predicted extracellular nuclease
MMHFHRATSAHTILVLILSLGLVLSAGTPIHAAPVIITQWTFDSPPTPPAPPPPSTGSGTAAGGPGLANENYYADNGSGLAWSFTGWSTGALDANDYFQFSVGTAGYQNIWFDFEERRSGTGIHTFELYYSTDGSSFGPLSGSATTVDDDTNWRAHTFDLSGVAGLNDNPNAAFRIYGYNAEAAGGTWRIDDVTIRGDPAIEIAPYVASTTPADGASGVATNTNLTVNFNELVNVAGSWFSLDCGGSGNHAATVSGGPQSFSLDPTTDFLGCEQCTLTILAAQVSDQDSDDPPDNMEADYHADFTTACACSTIPQIQGAGAASPCEGYAVNLSGCVTGVTATGFYLQDTAGDGLDASSDGIYVYLYSAWDNPQNLAAGHQVTVVGGEVQEYYDATEIYCGSSGCTLSQGGACSLPTPATVQQISVLGDHDPELYESVEFMRVQMSIDGFVQGPTKRFVSRFAHGDPEIGIVKWDLVGSLPNSPRIFEDDYAGYGSLNFLSGACNRDLPDVDFGDRIQATDLVGVMGYNFDEWQLILDETQVQDLTVTDDANTPDTEAPLSAQEFGLCTFNLENMFDAVDDGDGDMGDWTPASTAEYERMIEKRAKAIANDLQACSVVGVEEMEGKDPVWQDMVDYVNDTLLGQPGRFAFDYYESTDPRDITVGILYDTSRVSLISSTQRQGCTTTNYSISYTYADNTYGRVVANPCGSGTYPLFNRPPYVATLQVSDGPQFTLLVNHFKSMSGGEEETRSRREAQAQWVASLANEYSATTPNIAIVGDLNDKLSSTPIAILNDATTLDGQKLVNVHLAHVADADRYTYIFSGESGVLDYVFLSKVFDVYLEAASPMHINADWPDVRAMDSDNCAGGICPAGAQLEDDTSRRSSDHDPMFLRMGLTPTAVDLVRFEAVPRPRGIRVKWQTATEIDNLGFYLYRSESPDGPWTRLNEALIPSQAPGAPVGATYTWLDEAVQPGVTYFYRLEDVDIYGRSTFHGPVSATALQSSLQPRSSP